MSEIKKAALYIRVSTNYQVDKDSLPLQRSDLINYCSYMLGHNNYEVFEDAGYSGKNTMRPAYQKMMNKIRTGEFSHLIVWKIDRISRNLLDFAEMYSELKKLGVVFISRNEQFDTSTAMGEAMLKIILVFAELERNMTSERVTAIMLSRANDGKWNGANVPLGYKWNEDKAFPTIDPDESKTVKLIFDMYMRCQSSNFITRYLNENNISTKRGGKWSSKTVTDIIRNPFYKGTLRYNYRKSARGTIKPSNEWVVKDNNHPGIIDVETWETCNSIMNSHNTLKNIPGVTKLSKHTHIFSGKLVCSECGNVLTSSMDRPRKNGFTPSNYRCPGVNHGWGCNNNSCISDVTIGPFMFNFISNILKLTRNPEIATDIGSIERYLLSGKCFDVGYKIDRDSLELLYKTILNDSIPTVNYNLSVQNSMPTPIGNINELKASKAKTERAIERLKNLYLFSDSSLSEKDFIIENKKLTESLQQINQRITELNSQALTNNVDFIKAASAFLFANSLIDSEYIDYPKLAIQTDAQTLKDFINTTVDKIVVSKRYIQSVTFTNGTTYEFTHKKKD